MFKFIFMMKRVRRLFKMDLIEIMIKLIIKIRTNKFLKMFKIIQMQ